MSMRVMTMGRGLEMYLESAVDEHEGDDYRERVGDVPGGRCR